MKRFICSLALLFLAACSFQSVVTWYEYLGSDQIVYAKCYTNGRPNLLGQGTPGTYNDDAFVRSLTINTDSVIWTEQ
jgi:hypothetical protein